MTALIDLYRTSHAALVTWVVQTYGLSLGCQWGNEHRLRREEIALRLRLYRDDARKDFEQAIDTIFDHPEVREQRRRLLAVCMEHNVTRRIVDEVASLYNQPAVRKLRDAGQDQRFHVDERRLSLHEIWQEAHRLCWLCNEVLIWQYIGVDDKPQLRVVTPDAFDAVPDPRDALAAAGVLVDCAPQTMLTGSAKSRLSHHELWDDTYRYLINQSGQLVDAAGNPTMEPIEHGLGRIPGTIIHRRLPTERILDSRPGRDIVSAHLGVAVLNVMTMRLAKSQGEQQPILKGPLANMATGQAMDGERPIALPPEVTAEMLNAVTSPDHYIATKREKLAAVAQSYGMSYEQMTYGSAAETSGKAYQARRAKLIELRDEQRRRAVPNEAAVTDLMGYASEGQSIDFSEQALPLDADEEVNLLDKKMRMGLDSPVSYIQRKNQDLTREQALAVITGNLSDFALVVRQARALNMPADADATQPGRSPEENGADNSRTPPEGGDRTNPAPGDGDENEEP